MKTISFTCHGNSDPAYSCNEPGDNSGEYVSVKEILKLIGKILNTVVALHEVVEFITKEHQN